MASLYDIFNSLKDAVANALRVKQVGADGSDLNPPTEETLEDILAELEGITLLVDDLEGFTDGLEGLLTSLAGYVDQLEGYTDGIEGLIDTVETKLAAIQTAAEELTADLSVSRNLDVDESGDNQVNTACKLYGYYFFNNATAVRYLKLYDKATAPTVGTDVPVLTIPLPPQSGANVSLVRRIPFANGLGVGATTGVADNNTGVPAANDVIVNLLYK